MAGFIYTNRERDHILFSHELTLDRRCLAFCIRPLTRHVTASEETYDLLLTQEATAYATDVATLVQGTTTWFADPHGARQRWGVIHAARAPFPQTVTRTLREHGYTVLDAEDYLRAQSLP
jgi:hypothetical protein